MGFGLPAAIGAKVAAPHKTVIDIDGDASFSMTAMELQTASQFGIGVKVLVLNNRFQGMVLQWQGTLIPYYPSPFLTSLCSARPLLRRQVLPHSDDEPRLYPPRSSHGRARHQV
jgi:hypothetical protein